MSDPVFVSRFRKEMQDFIDLKRAIGYQYQSEAGILKRFDVFLADRYSSVTSLTKDVITGWCAKSLHETPANQCSRVSVVRQFSKYLDGLGADAWIIPNNYYPKGKQYIPHIYTPDELRRFFAATDKCHYCSETPYRHLVMPVFYRLLFSCGLRCSEARLLKVRDVDLENKVLSIIDSKNHNSRLVPMSDSISMRMRSYAEKVHLFPELDGYFFPAFGNKPMTVGNVYKNFRRFLWCAEISHTGTGPRVHDFRHAYCIYRLKAWVEEDRDLMVLIPMMRTYLGHQTFNETAYYLRLTADVFPNIRLKLERHFADIIPDVRGDAHETD